ncbi:archaea-specific SMC-related protein [Halovenus halobia]|uniref:archaea-specific SMC-related protein n=1 Tax=Halovenus halobia TaxID=3396622 RepID=UPI003F54AB9F
MQGVDATESQVTVHAVNIGGIRETEVDIPPGVTVLSGRNATNRTSFLQTIMAAMGSDAATLKGDAEEGAVELSIDGEQYRRTLHRTEGGVRFEGEPYLDDPTLGNLFAFLLESNDARQAVIRKQELRDLIMEPVDTDEIQAEIDRLEATRAEVDDELDAVAELKEELPGLEQRKQELAGEIEQRREELAAIEADLESMESDVEQTRAEKQELDAKLEELRDLRADLESVRSDIDIQQESIESLREELAESRAEREELDTLDGDPQAVESQLRQLRTRKRTLESEASELQDILQFNEEMLDGEETAVSEVLRDTEADNPTDQLLDDAETVCWTCGSEVPTERVEQTIETLRELRQQQTSEIRSIETELAELREQKERYERQQRREESLAAEIADAEAELQQRTSRLQQLRERREQLSEEVAELEQTVTELESEEFSEVLQRHREANQQEFELERLESELAEVTDRIKAIESELARETELRERRETIVEELQEQRTRIDRTEREAVEEFNERMAEILEMLQYDNLARIWIERKQQSGHSDRDTTFELHVVRTTESGASYEDTIDHLSESEREVTGLTFALAGYLVHDVHETVPFMLLDSLEAIDSDRLADLVSYFAEYSEYLVVALLPEDAQALSDEYTRVTEI